METVLVAHGDADGIISVAIALKKLYAEKPKIYFTYPAGLKNTLSNLISKSQVLERIFIFDLAADRRTITLASTFEKAIWIDHHEWEISEYPPNVEVILDKDAASAAELVAKYLDISSELVELANQIDKDEIKSDEAEFLRNLVGALKWKYKGMLLYNRILALSKTLALRGVQKLEEDMAVARLLNDYLDWLKDIKDTLLDKVKTFEIDGRKVAIYETTQFFPTYVLTKKLLEHKDAPFDVIACITRHMNRKKTRIYTKLELRTHTGANVYAIALQFGGGGHRVASAATLTGFFSLNDLLKKIAEVK